MFGLTGLGALHTLFGLVAGAACFVRHGAISAQSRAGQVFIWTTLITSLRGRFLADLYHRLSVYPLQVPPLRERGRDVLTLAGGFLEENQHRLGARNLRLAPAASAALLTQRWPGNVRVLEHLISRAALRAWSEQGRAGEVRHLGLDIQEPAQAPAAMPQSATSSALLAGQGLREATESFQRQWIEAALRRHGGSLAGAARDAGMDRSNLLRLAKRLGLHPSADKG